MQRYFTKLKQIPAEYLLESDIFHHAINVMRFKPGDQFELVTANQQVALMELTVIQNKQATAKVLKTYQLKVELPVAVTLLCGLAKNSKPELLVQKATELGADKIVFFNARFSVAWWDAQKAGKKTARLQKIAQAAAQQSHRTLVPTVTFVSLLKNFDFTKYPYRLTAYEEVAKQNETQRLRQLTQKIKATLALSTLRPKVVAVFGPEGGLAESEIAFLQQQGCILVGLGPRILRAETAPWYLLAALSFALELG